HRGSRGQGANRVRIALAVAFLALAAAGVLAQQPSPVPPNYAPHAGPEQPIPFSHKTHVSRGLRCQMCHANPDPGAMMTFPATSTCMGCHMTVAKDRPAIMKLAEFARSNQAIPWVRVY